MIFCFFFIFFQKIRFHTLYNVYGRVEPLAEVDLSPPKSAAIKVTYTWCDDEDDCLKDNKKIQELKIDLNKSVKDFKLQLRYSKENINLS
jgi:hypothetical protein